MLWVNASALEKGLGGGQKARLVQWRDWCRQHGTKLLIKKLESCRGDHRPSSVTNSVMDTTRRQYQGIDKAAIRGTWARIDLATAYIQHVDKDFHANWCGIMGKVYSGDHSAVADVLAETDRVAGTESIGVVTTKRRRESGLGSCGKKGRLGDIAAFMDPGVDIETAVALYERSRIAQSPEYMGIIKLREDGLFL
ncbi:hypothetical protein GHT06_003770 [Daphnia sinensis]|uniref:KilA/APSES-type HTH DNA-binding domain-containing protein n=1 Tax=Daphnia sinensis TaxID=1820382 RepID=A0AAD5PLY7_9CRUS|nr:hypothetical protein GHT06_003770 [Daphnia sinensis]